MVRVDGIPRFPNLLKHTKKNLIGERQKSQGLLVECG